MIRSYMTGSPLPRAKPQLHLSPRLVLGGARAGPRSFAGQLNTRGDFSMDEPQPLSFDEIARIRASFDRFWSLSSGAGKLFYDRLFEVAPEVRPLFQGDMAIQQRKFMATLATIVGNLDEGVPPWAT